MIIVILFNPAYSLKLTTHYLKIQYSSCSIWSRCKIVKWNTKTGLMQKIKGIKKQFLSILKIYLDFSSAYLKIQYMKTVKYNHLLISRGSYLVKQLHRPAPKFQDLFLWLSYCDCSHLYIINSPSKSKNTYCYENMLKYIKKYCKKKKVLFWYSTFFH